MNDRLYIGRTLLLCAVMAGSWACDDEAPSTGRQDMLADDGMGGMGGDQGPGGMGGTPPMRCIRDNQCPDDQYCAIPAGQNVGDCTDGCRTDDPATCDGEQVCDAMTRTCVDPPCEDDDDCGAGEYCNGDGACVDGCSLAGDDCSEPDGAGRAQVCDEETRACVSIFPCCAQDTCTEGTEAACADAGGEVLLGVASCQVDPCGPACESDDECQDGQYCNTDDGRCASGCRVDVPDSCPPDQVCDPEKHTCEDRRCLSDDECPPEYYCDPDTDTCQRGCREEPDNCPDGQQCVDNECVARCDPRAPVGDAAGCPAGSYCDPITFNCFENCGEHDDCDPDRYCDRTTARCVIGCRDDEGVGGEPNNDFATATPIELRAGGDPGTRVGSALGRIICGNDPDFFSVDLQPGERMRVRVVYERDAGNLDVRLHGDEVVDGPIEVEGLEVPVAIEYPGAGVTVARPATYYIEVYPAGNDPLLELEYRVEISVVDALAGCFPDAREPGDNNRGGATVVGERGDVFQDATICPGDLDHFRLVLNPNDGLRIQLDLDPIDANVEAYLYPANGNPGTAPYVLRAANNHRMQVNLGANAFRPGGDWYLQVAGINNAVAEYDLTIQRDSADVCGTDSGTERNDTLEEAVLLDGNDLPAPQVDVPLTVDIESAICTAGAPDVDVYCFAAAAGEILEAYAVSPPQAVNGTLAIQFLDAAGIFVGSEGRQTVEGSPVDPARVVNARAGLYCVRVSGLNGAQGPYRLTVERQAPPVGECALDTAEVARRDDRPNTARDMVDVGGNGRRYVFDEGYICDVGGQRDQDWYSFNVAEARSSLCIVVDGFDHDAADVDLDVFPSEGFGDPCMQGNCMGRAACIDNQCTAQLDTSASAVYDFEMVNLRRPFVGDRTGEFLLRISHTDATQGPYAISVNVTPTEPCVADGQEADSRNDNEVDATYLGAGQVAVCDSWICRNERVQGDWYAIDVPAGEDRSIVINYSNPVEGRLDLTVNGPTVGGTPGEQALGKLTAGNHQCVNIEGGAQARTVTFRVAANTFADQERIDYSLRVVPTDLAANREGACELLGAANFPACPPRNMWPPDIFGDRTQPDNCWAWITLP